MSSGVRWFGLMCVVFFFPTNLNAQTPVSLVPNLSISPVTLAVDAVRMAYNPVTGKMMLLSMNGDISSFEILDSASRITRLYSVADHGLPLPALGFDIGSDGTLYIVGNDAVTHPGSNVGIVKRGVPNGVYGYTWETVFRTVPYPRSGTNYDHNMNAIVVSPDGTTLFVNSGSRTDHGEVQSNNGVFLGVREVPLTSAILQVPANSTNLVLENDQSFLEQNGYLFADGVRNSFSLAFDADGRLYGTENSGDRDDNEELNLLVQGGHYGFPWRMGLNDTPMRFPGYQPANDLLLNPEAGAVQGGHFYEDAAYPDPPQAVVFVDPVQNLGPDADFYRDPISGQIMDASNGTITMATFTSHRSPLGLVFDKSNKLPGDYAGDGFVLSWTGSESPLLNPFSGEGEDVLHLDFVEDGTGTILRAKRVASNFRNPIDAVLIDNQLFVLEFGSGARVWKVEFTSSVAVENEVPFDHVELSTFPNPVSNRFNLSMVMGKAGDIQVDLMDMSGKNVEKVFTGVIPSGQFDMEHTLSRDLPAGVYLLVATGSSFGRQVRKVIIL